MIKKIYALRKGEESKIYIDWMDFFEAIEDLKDFESKTFCYDDALTEEGEWVPYSLKWAFKCAEAYLAGEEITEPSTEERRSGEGNSKDGDSDEMDSPEEYYEEIDLLETDPEDMYAEEEEVPFEEVPQTKKDKARNEEMLNVMLRKKLALDGEFQYGTPWLDMILEQVGRANTYATDRYYAGRYFASSLYTMLLYLILSPASILNEQHNRIVLLSDREITSTEKVNWFMTMKHELLHSNEYKELKERFDKNNMLASDLLEVKARNMAAAKDFNETILRADIKSYSAMKKFIQAGNHTLVDLYEELISNAMYRKALKEVTGPFINPDLEEQIAEKEEDFTLQQIVQQSSAISEKLKSAIIGQDAAIDKLEKAYFHKEKSAGSGKGPRNVFLFAGPPGVGKTFMAENFADALGIPYRRFDMSGYANRDSLEEIEGISTFWKSAKPGVLTSYVMQNPKCVLLFDEIEKAAPCVIRLFLQILDEGTCFDRYYDTNVFFHGCILIFTTNAGKQLYRNADKENLTLLSDKVVMDSLEKDINPETKMPYFPPELVSRMSSHTVIMFNHLKADAIRRVIKKDLQKQLLQTKQKYGFDISKGSELVATTAQYAMGGSGDARNASRLAGKLIDRELYEMLILMEEKAGQQKERLPLKVSWECDFENAAEGIQEFYTGEKQGTILVFGKVPHSTLGFLQESLALSQSVVKATTDMDECMDIARKENVLFAVVDFVLGMEEAERSLDVSDADTMGHKAFLALKEDNEELPVFVLCNDSRYTYSDREKQKLQALGAEGFIAENEMVRDMNQIYYDVCCQKTMGFLTLRHQVLSYKTRKELDVEKGTAKIIFYNLQLEMAVEAEDKSTLVSDELRPNKHWEDIFVSEDVRNELLFAIHYLQNPKEYKSKGVREPKGALMYGPPGTGKTSLAKVVATESDVNFLSISADELMNGGADKVHEIFAVARKYAPAVLFIDEIDAVGISRKASGANSTLNALLTEMDGFKRVANKPVYVMAATNLGSAIDPALGRRFDRSFCVDLPEKDGRRWILEKLLHKHSNMFAISEKEIESIVERSVGMSPAAIENVVETALREGIRSDRMVDDGMFDEIFEKCHYGEAREVSSKKEVEHTAYHEAGHAIIQLYYGGAPNYMSVVARGNFNGYVQPQELGGHPTKEMLLQKICTSLGGRACEMEFGYGITPGASVDLKHATAVAASMVCEFGMYEEEVGLAYISEEELRSNEAAKKLINRILSEQLKVAREIIAEKKEEVRRLVTAVLSSEQKYLTQKDIQKAYKGGEDYDA